MAKKHVHNHQRLRGYSQALWELNLFIQNSQSFNRSGDFENELISYIDGKRIEVCDQLGHIEHEKHPLWAEID